MKPDNAGTGLVIGQFGLGVVDSADPDMEPEVIPLAGTVTFTPSVPYLPNPTAAPNPITIVTSAITAVLDHEGYVCTPGPDGVTPFYRGVRLFATNDPDLSVENWTWSVVYTFQPVKGIIPKIPSHAMALLEGEEIDLTKVVPVPSSPGIGTPQALALLAAAEAAAKSVRADADAGLFNGEAATLQIGSVSSGPVAEVINIGDEQNAILEITLEKGDKGDTGTGVPDAGTALQMMRMDSSGNTTEWVTPTKTVVGLSNVDNTTDLEKPVSTMQKLALDEKLDAVNLPDEVDSANKNLIENSASLTAGALSAAFVSKPTRVYDLRDSAAVGNGIVDDTAAIQAVITSMPNNSRLIAERGKTYLVGELVLTSKSNVLIDGNGATFRLKSTGARIAAFAVAGSCSNLGFHSIQVKGSAIVADAHCGIVGRSNAVIKNVEVTDCTIEDVTLGVSFSSESAGAALTGVVYRGNHLRNIVGVLSGVGYGLHVSSAGTADTGAVIEGNIIESAQRHSIYIAKGTGATVANNVIMGHRDATSDGNILPAIMVARSTNVSISGNVVLKPKGGALYLGGVGDDGTAAGAYVVSGNVFSDPQDAAALVHIGQATPAVDSVPTGVTFSSNMLTSSAARTLMQVYNGLNINITNNQFRMVGEGAANAVTLVGAGVTGSNYMDRVTLMGNYFDLDVVNPASKTAVRFSPGHDAHTTKYWFRGNRLVGGAGMFISSSVITNPNISIEDQVATGISFASGVSSVPMQLNGVASSVAPGAGSAGILPSNPRGYVTLNINGNDRQIAYY